jgi:hypothetical protein
VKHGAAGAFWKGRVTPLYAKKRSMAMAVYMFSGALKMEYFFNNSTHK